MVKNLLRKRQDATALPDNRAETGKIQTFVSKITRNGNTLQTSHAVGHLRLLFRDDFVSSITAFKKSGGERGIRRERDSNPRWVTPHLISSQAQSATLSSLRADSLIGCDYRMFGKLNQQAAKQNDNVLKTPSKHERTKKHSRITAFFKNPVP